MRDLSQTRRRQLVVVLLGFSLFGALFAATYYQPQAQAQQGPTEEELRPMYRLGPGEMQPLFIDPGEQGETVHVNLTVLEGGPLSVYMMDMENITMHALNATTFSFDVTEDVEYNKTYSRSNITDAYDFSFELDGENRTALLLASGATAPPDAEHDENVTEVAVDTWYPDTEAESLVIAYMMATPSLLLVGFVTYRRFGPSG